MIDKISQYFCRKGYLHLAVREKELEVNFKVTGDGLYFVCLVDDTGDWLKSGKLSPIMETVGAILKEKYPKFSNRVEGYAVIATNEPTRTRSKCADTDKFWMIHAPGRKLMIFEDQADEFYDAKPILESFLKQNAVSLMFGQLAELFTPVNTALIIINIITFIVMEIIGDTQDVYFMHAMGGLNVADVVLDHEYWRLFTCAFLHFGFLHLFYNMIALLYLGRPFEKAIGSLNYILFYLLCIISSSVVSTWWFYLQHDWLDVSAGASGAIMGVAGGVAFLLLKNRKQNSTFTFVRWLIFVGIMALQGFSSTSGMNVNNAAHIGGLVSGFLLAILFVFIKGLENKNQQKEKNNG